MKTSTILCLVMTLCATPHAVAKDMSTLYDDATLIAWQSITPPEIEQHLQQIILPVLTPHERRVLAGVSLIFPLRGQQRDMLEFYATTSPPAVTMPMLSLHFVGELCLAFAWLSTHDYSLETVVTYVNMLKYRDASSFPDGQYPQPLPALQIPPQAREEPKTFAVFQRLYTSVIVFILAHELGHIYHQHAGDDPRVTRQRARHGEEQADHFAVDIMRRIGDLPIGMTFFFTALAHWEPHRADFSSAQAYQAYRHTAPHPLTSQRLLALATRLQESAGDFTRNEADREATAQPVQDIARDLTQVATLLDDADMQQRFAMAAPTTDVVSLAPRPPRVLSPPSQDKPQPSLAFHGTYEGEMTAASGGMFTRVALKRHDNRVTGTFRYGRGMGIINGTVDHNTLYFVWQLGDAYGRGLLYTNQHDDMLSGTWGHKASARNGGRWLGKRQ